MPLTGLLFTILNFVTGSIGESVNFFSTQTP